MKVLAPVFSRNPLSLSLLCRLHVCCLGAGPGSEILGLHQLFPANTEWMLLDNCEQWYYTAQILLHDVCDVPFRYGTFDISNGHGRSNVGDLGLTANYAFKKVSVPSLVVVACGGFP